MNVIFAVFAAVFLMISSVALYIANAGFSTSSPAQPSSKQDAMNTTITAGLQLANQSSQLWQEKLHRNQQQEQPLTANGPNSHDDKLDNHSPTVVPIMPF